MVIQIELRPEEEKALRERARLAGSDPAEYVQGLVRDHIRGGIPQGALDDLIDHEFVEYREWEADDAVTLEEVRAATAKIGDSMARVIVEEERADRFRGRAPATAPCSEGSRGGGCVRHRPRRRFTATPQRDSDQETPKMA